MTGEAAALLTEAAAAVGGDRQDDYGSPVHNLSRIAALWTVQFGPLLADGARFTAVHVAQAMSHVKLSRMVAAPKRDNWLDLAGYAACGAECEAAQ